MDLRKIFNEKYIKIRQGFAYKPPNQLNTTADFLLDANVNYQRTKSTKTFKKV